MRQLFIGAVLCVVIFTACDLASNGSLPIDDIVGSNNDDPNINPTIDPPTIDPWAFPVVTGLWDPVGYTNDAGISVTDAYPIDNWRQLQFIGETFLEDITLLAHTYYLTDDIIFPSRDTDVPDEHSNDPYVVDGFVPIGTYDERFLGNFDGQGYIISDINIIQNVNDSNDDYIGLFGVVGDITANQAGITPVIQNLTLRNAQVTGNELVGILAGSTRYATVKNITIEGGSVQGESSAGGLVGVSVHGIVSYCGASASVSGDYVTGGLIGRSTYTTIELNYATGDVTGALRTGGLIGYTYEATIENNYSLGTINAQVSRTGGLIGHAQGSRIATNYSRSEVTGNVDVGGLVGYSSNDILENNFWDISSNSGTLPSGIYPSYGIGNPENNTGATALTSPTSSSFIGFTFGSTTEGWNTPADGEWPTLAWQESN